jgi:PAS domain S-box-containing protein
MVEWLAPPRHEDPEQNERAAIVWYTVLLAACCVGIQGLVYLIVPTMDASAVYLLPELIGMVVVLATLKRGHLRGPTYLLLGLFTVLVTAFIFFGGGLRMAFPPVMGTIAILGAIMAGPRVGAAMTAWAVGCTVAVFFLGSSEWMLIPGQDETAVQFTIQLITILLGGTLVTYSVHRLSLALSTSRTQTAHAERVAARLERARRYTAEIVQGMAEGVLVTTRDGTVLEANDAAVRLFATGSSDALVGKALDALLSAEDLDRLDASQTPGATAFGQSAVRTAGRVVPVRVARSPVTDEEGEARFVFVLTDITLQEEARRRSDEAARAAESANRAKSQFLANMSHELRTPLNAVIGYSDMLLDDVDEEAAADVHRIRQAGRHLLALINDVLDMSKIEAGRMEVVVEPVSLSTLLFEVESTVLPAAQSRNNVLEVDAGSAPAIVHTDGRKLRQILLNLLSNAVKFTRDGRVEVRVDAEEAGLRIAVIDTGIGIAPGVMERLFQPFVQADESTSRRYGGTGLGLALSRRFAEMLGGTLTASSVPGEGSTFVLSLPTTHATVATPAPEVDPGADPLVLCVDDDPATLDLLGRTLRRQGLRVASARSGADALEVARTHRPAVITLDVMMPEMDGWTLLQRLREDPDLRHVPVVMVSMVDHSQASALALGASDYLVKPVEPDVLLGVLQRYLQSGRGQVLVVDDEEDMRDLLARLLGGEGWTVVTAPSSRAALDELQSFTPDLVILDLMMPEMDGFAFVETVRASPALRDLPILVLTAMELTHEQWVDLSSRTEGVVSKQSQGLARVLAEVRRFAGR